MTIFLTLILLQEQQWFSLEQMSLLSWVSIPETDDEAVVKVTVGLRPGLDVLITTSGTMSTEMAELYWELSSVIVDIGSTGCIRGRPLFPVGHRGPLPPSVRGLARGFGDGGDSCSASLAGMTYSDHNQNLCHTMANGQENRI